MKKSLGTNQRIMKLRPTLSCRGSTISLSPPEAETAEKGAMAAREERGATVAAVAMAAGAEQAVMVPAENGAHRARPA